MPDFTLTQEHIDLLQGANVRWSNVEYGAPKIDGKRPFGNGGAAIVPDMCDILGLDPEYESDVEHVKSIYYDLDTALQIVLQNQTFEPGVFHSEPYHSDWERYTASDLGLDVGDPCPSCEAETVSLDTEYPAIVKSLTESFMKCRNCDMRFPIE